jgi:hypothetical protein
MSSQSVSVEVSGGCDVMCVREQLVLIRLATHDYCPEPADHPAPHALVSPMYTKVDTKHSTNVKELQFSTRHYAVTVNRSSTPPPAFIVYSNLLAVQLSVL